MTRYARSGNTQKHKKMPGVATPWSEFSHQDATKKKKQKKNKKTINTKSQLEPSNMQFQSGEMIDKTPKNNLMHDTLKKTSDITGNEDKCSFQQNMPVEENENKTFTKHHNANKDSKSSDNIQISQSQVLGKKQSIFRAKVMKKRIEQNMILLSPQVERRIYNTKRKLFKQGCPPEIIKDIIRKERRKEELKFRRNFNPSKPCYNCRKVGHLLADCPEKLHSSSQETGICFKCGSVDHTSFKCPNKVQGFPFAKCFICKEQGHISKDCPNNQHGIYIKGGRCNLCGNVNHLRKDCPSLKTQNDDESVLTLHTINEATSIDEEVQEKQAVKKEKTFKKPKVVKF